MRRPINYTPEQKEKFAREWLEGNLTYAQLAERIGVQAYTLRGWVRRVKAGIPINTHGGKRWGGPGLSEYQKQRIKSLREHAEAKIEEVSRITGHDRKTIIGVLREFGMTDPRKTGRPRRKS